MGQTMHQPTHRVVKLTCADPRQNALPIRHHRLSIGVPVHPPRWMQKQVVGFPLGRRCLRMSSPATAPWIDAMGGPMAPPAPLDTPLGKPPGQAPGAPDPSRARLRREGPEKMAPTLPSSTRRAVRTRHSQRENGTDVRVPFRTRVPASACTVSSIHRHARDSQALSLVPQRRPHRCVESAVPCCTCIQCT